MMNGLKKLCPKDLRKTVMHEKSQLWFLDDSFASLTFIEHSQYVNEWKCGERRRRRKQAIILNHVKYGKKHTNKQLNVQIK